MIPICTYTHKTQTRIHTQDLQMLDASVSTLKLLSSRRVKGCGRHWPRLSALNRLLQSLPHLYHASHGSLYLRDRPLSQLLSHRPISQFLSHLRTNSFHSSNVMCYDWICQSCNKVLHSTSCRPRCLSLSLSLSLSLARSLAHSLCLCRSLCACLRVH